MKYALYIFIGLLVFMVVRFISINFESELSDNVRIIVSAISMLCAVIVVCTLTLTDAIKSNNKGN